MNVDEIAVDVRKALGLREGHILVNIIVMGEYVTINEGDESPDRRRLSMISSDELEPWTSIGMLEMAKLREHDAIRNADWTE